MTIMAIRKVIIESMETRQITFGIGPSGVDVSSILLHPENASWIYVLGHGAGAGMHHPFLDRIANQLALNNIATFRYQFPFMEQGRRTPNPKKVLVQTVRSAVDAAKAAAPGLRIIAGGKSLGGRMTSVAYSESPIESVEGLAFLGFPLHAPGREGVIRGEHLKQVDIPMLFLQGTRDKLANLELLGPLCDSLGSKTTLHILESGDHSYKPLKRSGRTFDEVMTEAETTLTTWVEEL
jgi:predicted alpha/beta-hydrolase family hydrolase